MTGELAALLSILVLAVANQIIIPAPTDLIMLGLALTGVNPLALVIFATIGATIGAGTDYFIGRFGMESIPWLRKSTKTKNYRRAEHFYEKYGYWTLLFSFFPFIGKYFPFVSGIFKGSFVKTIIIYDLGRILYYGIAAFLLFGLGVLR